MARAPRSLHGGQNIHLALFGRSCNITTTTDSPATTLFSAKLFPIEPTEPTMPPRQRTQGGNTAAAAAVPASAADPAASVPSAASHTTKPATATSSTGAVGSSSSSSSKANSNDAAAIANNVWRNYVNKTDQRTKLLDVFMVFLVAVGALQFLYCVIGGNFVSCPSSLFSGLWNGQGDGERGNGFRDLEAARSGLGNQLTGSEDQLMLQVSRSSLWIIS